MAQTNTKVVLPGKVLAARTIYIENRTNNFEIQNHAYLELAKWGRFQIVDSPKKADLVLRLSGSNMVTFVPAGEKTYIYDPAVSGRSAAMEEQTPRGPDVLDADRDENGQYAVDGAKKNARRASEAENRRWATRGDRAAREAPRKVEAEEAEATHLDLITTRCAAESVESRIPQPSTI